MLPKAARLKQMIANVSILLISSLCLAYAGLNLYALVRANLLIFPVPQSSYRDDDTILKLKDGREETISAYFLPAEGSERLLLYSHGNGEDIGDIRPFMEVFQRNGISVLTYDYPGYGTSSGAPSEEGCYAAIDAAFDYATGELGYSSDRIVLYGRSLGGGPATWLAERASFAGLILDGTFTSTFRVLTEVKLLAWDRFDNYARLPNIEAPTLILHGTEDRTVPFSHAQKNWEVMNEPKYRLFVEGAHHGNLIEVAGESYWTTVIPFIKGELK